MAANVIPRLPDPVWARLKGTVVLTLAGLVVVISMFGWLGGLTIAVLDLCAIFVS